MAEAEAIRPGHPDPPVVFTAALAAMVLLAMAIPLGEVASGPWRAAGLLPVVCGVALHVAAWRRLCRRGTPVRADREPATLVTSGPYAWSRNPMYLAGVLILTGTGLLLGAASPFGVVAAWTWIAHHRFLPAEERALEERFGEAYEAYRQEVARWA